MVNDLICEHVDTKDRWTLYYFHSVRGVKVTMKQLFEFAAFVLSLPMIKQFVENEQRPPEGLYLLIKTI